MSSTTRESGILPAVTGSLPAFYAYDAAGGIDCSSGWTDITLDTEVVEDASHYTHASDAAAVTILRSGRYMVRGELCMEMGSNAVNAAQFQLVKNSSAISGSISEIIMRYDSSAGGYPLGASIIIGLIAGDTIKMQAQRLFGSATHTTTANTARLSIMRIG